MYIIEECLNFFKEIDIDFDLYIVADTQNKTAKIANYLRHADESEFFSRREFAEIASALFYVFGFAKVFYSEIDFIKFVLEENPNINECYIYNFSRDGLSEGKKSLIPSFCDLYGFRYTGSNAFTISLIRNKWFFSQILFGHGIKVPENVLYQKETLNDIEKLMGQTIIVKNIFESASQGLSINNRLKLDETYESKIDTLMRHMKTEKVLLQQYIAGLECEILVLQFKGKYYALEPIEIIIENNEFLDTLSSNLYSYSFMPLSEKVSSDTIQSLKQIAVKAASILNIKDYARFDFRLKGDQPYLIDIAGTPYTIKHSSVAYLFENIMRLDYNDIYKVVMACCISNYNID